MKDQALTKDRLIETAARLLWQRGYQASGVDDLCAAAGARKGSFYHFFASKADLAIAAAEANWALVRAEVFEPVSKRGAPGLARFRRLVDRVGQIQEQAMKPGSRFLGCPFGNLGQETAHQDERLRRTVDEIFEAHCRYLEAWLREAQALGEVPKGDAKQRARYAFAVLEGALLLAKVSNSASDFRRVAGLLPASLRAVSG